MTRFLCLLVLIASSSLLCRADDDHKSHESHEGGVKDSCPLMVKAIDSVQGKPAAGVKLSVMKKQADASWKEVATGVTGKTGESHHLIGDKDFTEGTYKVRFETQAYWTKAGITPFHEAAEVVFMAHDAGHKHYHIPMLLSPYFYATGAIVGDAEGH
uniref:Transthyretin n=1 Tax=Lethenteron reissneri TaxID=7753 RepID=A0A3S5XI48_LETRI|nr:transthyretin [Lethenteron reissneri]